jgi:enolase
MIIEFKNFEEEIKEIENQLEITLPEKISIDWSCEEFKSSIANGLSTFILIHLYQNGSSTEKQKFANAISNTMDI